MTDPDSSFAPPPRRGALPAILVLAAAGGWLVSRVFVGLDFTDEMQYYGEIASLVRTGKFFQADLFVQQLGYLLLFPFFKLHSLAFPDQSHFVVFGRLLLLGGYVAVAALFWRSSRVAFSRADRIAGLAAFIAWIPFQIFAPSYNSIAYLLVVAGVSRWVARDRMGTSAYAFSIAALGTALTVTYPTAGVAGIALAIIDARIRGGWRAAARVIIAVAATGIVAAAAMFSLHGRDFAEDLLTAVRFTGAFGTGTVVARPDHLVKLGLYVLTVLLLLRHLRAARNDPTVGAVAPLPGWVVRALAAVALAVLLWSSIRMPVGDIATVVLVALAAGLVLGRARSRDGLAGLLITGLVLGSVVAASSGNGAGNFGIGAAGVLPFLVLHTARAACHDGRRAVLARIAAPSAAALILVNGVLHPYREQRPWHVFRPVSNVPAFAGIWTSEVKIAAVEAIRTLTGDATLTQRRVLVAGPHPWIYFVVKAVPATPMVFMHFSAERESAYDIVAERLTRNGPIDAIFVTNVVPPAIGREIQSWAATAHGVRTLMLPIGFIRRYRQQTGHDFAAQIYFLERPSEGNVSKISRSSTERR